MDSRSMLCEESTIVEAESKKNMIDYCLNTMRKRTIDQQLTDMSAIMKSPLELEIVYQKTGMKVSYRIGQQNASVNGLDESACVRQCKCDILRRLKVFCSYINDFTQILGPQALMSKKTPNPSSESQDVYSEIELCKQHTPGETAMRFVLVDDPETNIAEELCDFVDNNDSPLVLKISYRPTEWDMVYKIGSHSASAKGSVKTTCTQQCKKQLFRELCAFVNNAKVIADEHIVDQEVVPKTISVEKNIIARNDAIGKNQQCEPNNEPGVESIAQLPETINHSAVSVDLPGTGPADQPRRLCNAPVPGAHEKYVNRAAVVLRNIARDTFPMSAEMFFEILVQTNHASRLHLRQITDCIVTNAIDKPDKCAVYAELCCYAIEKSWADSRVTVRQGLSYAFKRELIQSCREVLTQTGALPRVGTARQSERFEDKARDRAQGTCRLMGELFVRDQMFKTVMVTVNTFLETHDVNSIECICVLLTIIGPKLEKVIDASRQVYGPLESYSVAGYAGNTRLPQRTMRMIDSVLNVRKGGTRCSDSRRGGFAERNSADEGNCRERPLLHLEDHRAKPVPGPGILRRGQNPPSGTAMPTRCPKKHVTFNQVVSVLCFRRNAPM